MTTPTLLLDAAVFPLMPEGEAPERLTRAWKTIVATTESGKETRAALRSFPVRRYEFGVTLEDAEAMLRFRALWLATAQSNTQPLRFVVPLWPRRVTVESIAGTTVSGDFSYRFTDEEIARDPRALLWEDETHFELVRIAERSDSAVELVDAPEDEFGAGAKLVPVMNAWLEPPTVDLATSDAERVPLVFTEEVVGLAGADPTVGIARSPEVVDVTVAALASGSAWTGRKFRTFEARPVDAAGIVLYGLPVEWSVTPLGAGESNIRITEPYDGRQLHVAFDGGTGTYFNITATVGGLTSPVVVT